MMAIRDDERAEVLEEVLEQMEEIAEKLRGIQDGEIRYRVMAEFEGREGGWLGEFARDILERKLREFRGEDDEE
jgi:hypothetical protein